jgi:peptidyl-prolyl cis-trans isomerase SurA
LKKYIIAIPVLFLILSSVAFSQAEGDRVIAIAGNEVITESDFQYQVQLYARQNQLREISPFVAQQIFQSMLTNKILLAKAIQDSIEVTEDEVSKELDSRLKGIIAQVGSVQKMEEVYGMSISKIKSTLKEDLIKNIKVEKLKRTKFASGVKVSDKEVRDFFATYKDSIPDVGEEMEIAHIFLERKVSDAEKKEAKQFAEQLLDSIKAGADFSDLARRYSGDSASAKMGGDLGFAKKGTYVKEFEETVFNLNEGQVSDIVETQFGYHIIKLTEKQGDKVRSKHILIKFPRLESSDFETINFLKDLKAKIDSGKVTYEEAAKLYSQDAATKDKGGYIGKVPKDQIDSSTVIILENLAPGQISDPVRTGSDILYGYEIYKLIKINPPHKLTLKDDFDKIKKFTEAYKENKEMEEWVNQIRQTIYVNIKM